MAFTAFAEDLDSKHSSLTPAQGDLMPSPDLWGLLQKRGASICTHTHKYIFETKKQQKLSWAVVAHAFNSSTREAEAGRFEFKPRLVCRVHSRTASITQRNPVSKSQKQNQKQ